MGRPNLRRWVAAALAATVFAGQPAAAAAAAPPPGGFPCRSGEGNSGLITGIRSLGYDGLVEVRGVYRHCRPAPGGAAWWVRAAFGQHGRGMGPDDATSVRSLQRYPDRPDARFYRTYVQMYPGARYLCAHARGPSVHCWSVRVSRVDGDVQVRVDGPRAVRRYLDVHSKPPGFGGNCGLCW
ncbi:hypothetical protein GCM10010123_24330 [Pilimelia anulata]|uniref:Uncharacterized protein n=1 Tax=Pilimelia anulata TaxID=53371 RepID=A0A8J3BC47_9ACTN|nr:hypothetical protein [Pilimelia anulata]GGJ93612.1 hypothetical protein GCM10010123_24330 [Pilimelia anulata]